MYIGFGFRNDNEFIEFFNKNKELIINSLKTRWTELQTVCIDFHCSDETNFKEFVLQLQDKVGYYLDVTNKFLHTLPNERIIKILGKYIPKEIVDKSTLSENESYAASNLRRNLKEFFNLMWKIENMEVIDFLLDQPYIQHHFAYSKGIDTYLYRGEISDWHKMLIGRIGEIRLIDTSSFTWDFEWVDVSNGNQLKKKIESLDIDIHRRSDEVIYTLPSTFTIEKIEEVMEMIKEQANEAKLQLAAPIIEALNKYESKKFGKFTLTPLGVETKEGFKAISFNSLYKMFKKANIPAMCDSLAGNDRLEYILE